MKSRLPSQAAKNERERPLVHRPTRLKLSLLAVVLALTAAGFVARGTLLRVVYERISLDRLEQVVRGDPRNELQASILGRRLIDRGQYGRAVAALQPATDASDFLGDLWLLRAEAHLLAGDQRLAYASAQLGLRTAVRPAPGHWILGRIEERRGDDRAAEKMYLAAIGSDPLYVPARLRLGRIALARGYTGEAVKHIEVAQSVQPDNAEALRQKAQAQLNLGQIAQAEQSVQAVIQRNSADAETYFLLGQILRSTPAASRRAEAEGAYVKALELDPALIMAHHELGMLYSEAGRLRQAVDEFRAVLADHPLFKVSYLPLIRCLLRLGRKAEANRLLREYRRLDEMDLDTAPLEYTLWAMPENVSLRVELARRYIRYKRPDLAQTQLSAVLASQPGNQEALRLQQKLQARKP